MYLTYVIKEFNSVIMYLQIWRKVDTHKYQTVFDKEIKLYKETKSRRSGKAFLKKSISKA